MKLKAELPNVIAFTGSSLRRCLNDLKKPQARIVLRTIKEALIRDQSFTDASDFRAAEKECIKP